MSIGLDFVKNVDRNWKNRLKSIDRMQNHYEEKMFEPNLKNYRFDVELTNIEEKPEIDYWKYWKKKYSIIR